MVSFIGFLLLLLVLLLVAPWVFYFVLRSQFREMQQDFQQRFENLFRQFDHLLHEQLALKKRISEFEQEVVPAAAPPVSEHVAAPVKSMEFRAPDPPAPVVVSSTPTPAPPTALPSVPVVPPRMDFPIEQGPTLFDRIKGGMNLEEVLGTNWLNKVGVILLVFGIAFFLAYQLQNLGPAGKVLVGFVVSAGLLGGGIWLERKDRYRVFARASIGGGWALAFFTTFAMYHVQAAKILQSQSTDLVLMFLVAAGMVLHTLRYRSQVVTGLAFLLAFSTVTISHVTVYSLTAGAVLALALATVVVRMRWYELEVFGIVAAYLNHWIWLRTIIEPMGAHKHGFPEFFPSAALLIFYWLVFRTTYVVRAVNSVEHERISTVSALLNSGLCLALLKYQSVHPEWAFWALLGMGLVELGFAHVPRLRTRRIAFAILSTIGAVLLVAAIPFRYSGANVEVLWLALAEAMVLAGVFVPEIIFIRLGYAACVATFVHMLGVNAARIYGIRMDDALIRGHYGLAVVFAVAVTAFYGNAYLIQARWPQLFTHTIERRAQTYLSIAAAILGAVGLWIAFPQAQTAMAWSLFALGLAYLGDKTNSRDISTQAIAVYVITVLRVFAVNFGTHSTWGPASQRLITVSVVISALYLASRWARLPWFWEGHVRDALRWTASILGAFLLWYELRPVGVAVAWALFAVVLLECGIALHSLQLRLQAYAGLAATFVRIFVVNLNAEGQLGSISPRVYTVVPIVLAFFYSYWRMTEADPESLERDHKWHLPSICAYFGTIAFSGLVRFELDADWVAPAWGLMVLVLIGTAWSTGRKTFLHQSMLLAFAALSRAGLHNLYERSVLPAPAWHGRWLTVGLTVAALFVGLVPAFRLRELSGQESQNKWVRYLSALARRPEQVLFFFGLGLLTLLLWTEMPSGMRTVSWGVLGVLVFLFALWVKERSYRLAGLGLLLLCVGKIVVVDVWGLNPRDRYITFIILGSALLLVSFLYSRHREAIRQYL